MATENQENVPPPEDVDYANQIGTNIHTWLCDTYRRNKKLKFNIYEIRESFKTITDKFIDAGCHVLQQRGVIAQDTTVSSRIAWYTLSAEIIQKIDQEIVKEDVGKTEVEKVSVKKRKRTKKPRSTSEANLADTRDSDDDDEGSYASDEESVEEVETVHTPAVIRVPKKKSTFDRENELILLRESIEEDYSRESCIKINDLNEQSNYSASGGATLGGKNSTSSLFAGVAAALPSYNEQDIEVVYQLVRSLAGDSGCTSRQAVLERESGYSAERIEEMLVALQDNRHNKLMVVGEEIYLVD